MTATEDMLTALALIEAVATDDYNAVYTLLDNLDQDDHLELVHATALVAVLALGGAHAATHLSALRQQIIDNPPPPWLDQ